MQKIRIIYFQQNLAVGATEEYLYLLMQGIDKNRFLASCICPEDTALDSFVLQIKELGLKVYRYPIASTNLRTILNLYFFFKKFRFDIAHFNDPCIKGVIAARLAGVPVLVLAHHTPTLLRQYNLKGRILEKAALRYCGAHFIFTSGFDLEAGISKDKIRRDKSAVIYYGLPPERFNAQYDRDGVYHEFGIPQDCRIIGNVARLSAQKGQAYLIEAAALVIKKDNSVRFFFVGEGELRKELKNKIREAGLEDYFIFTGQRNDIPRLLSAFSMLVMPSLFEGLCFAVIEAAAMGIPVIATAVGGMRCSVIDGKTGILVPAGDSQALSAGIIWMLEHPQEAKAMGLAGKEHFKASFTQEKMIKNTQQLYTTLFAVKAAE